MSNSSQSHEARPSSADTTTEPNLQVELDDDIPQAKDFPVITIVLSLDDPSEPNHVDLGSIPPAIAAGALEGIATHLKRLTWPSRVTYAGQMIFDPSLALPSNGFDDMDDDDDVVA